MKNITIFCNINTTNITSIIDGSRIITYTVNKDSNYFDNSQLLTILVVK